MFELESYKQMLETAPFGYGLHRLILDEDGNPSDYEFLEINGTFERLTGLAKDALIGNTYKQIFPDYKSDSFDWIAYYGNVTLKRERRELEQYSKLLGRWYRIQIYSPQPLHFVTVFFDFTVDHYFSEASRELSTFTLDTVNFDAIAESMKKISVAKYSIMLSTKLIEDSTLSASILGLDRELDARCRVRSIEAQGYDKFSINFLEQLHKQNSDGKFSYKFESQLFPIEQLSFISEDKHLLLNSVPIFSGGVKVGAFLLMYEKPEDVEYICSTYVKTYSEMIGLFIQQGEREKLVTQQKTELESFFSVNLDLLCIADLNGKFVKLNVEWENVLGYKLEELQGASYSDFVHPDDLAATKEATSTLMNGEQVINFVNRYRSKDGSYKFLEWRSVPHGSLNYAAARDITKRIEHETTLSNYIKYAPYGIFIANAVGAYTYVNKEACRLIALSEEQLLSMSISDIVYQEDLVIAMPTFSELREKGQAENIFRVVSGFGEIRKWKINAVKISEDRFMAFVVDITESEEAKRELIESKEAFANYIDNAPYGIFVANARGKYLFVNQGAQKLTGYSEQELLALSIPDFIYPDDFPIGLQAFREGQEKGESVAVVRFKKKDGSIRWVKSKTVKLSDDRYIAFKSDITEQYVAEAELLETTSRMKKLAEMVPGVIYQFQAFPDGRSCFPVTSEHILEIYEVTPDEVKEDASKVYSRIHPEDYDSVVEKIGYSAKHLTLWQDEYRVILPERGERWLHGTAKPEKQQDESIIWYGYIMDITDRKKLERELILAKETAISASKAKSVFLANMSHEIRTPLNGVIGFTDLLRETTLTKVQKQYVEHANTSAHSLLGIINDILDFSKIEAGKIELEHIKTDIVELLESATDIIKYQAAEKNLELLLNIQPDLPRYAVVDPLRLKQILINLLGNAVKFTKVGEVELLASYTRIDDRRCNLSFAVRDTGIGLSKEHQGKLFKAFSQADSSTTRKFGGTGLGLIISNLLAEKMGGKIELVSIPDFGTTFYFSFETEFETAESSLCTDKKDKKISRALVVDDNERSRMVLQHTLDICNIVTIGCETSSEALKLIKENGNFDVVFIDFGMPFQDGLTTAKIIREKLNFSAEKLPIVLLTNSSQSPEDHEYYKDAKGIHLLLKPVKKSELKELLQELESEIKKPIQKIVVQEEIEVAKRDSIEYSPFSILIVEDVSINMVLTHTMTSKILPNAVIYEATNGVEAVDFLVHNSPQLVLMDVQMPEMDGLTATRLIRDNEAKSGRHTKIVALTAGAMQEEKEKCFAAGVDDYLAKPIEYNMLAATFKKYLFDFDPGKVNTPVDLTVEKISFNKELFIKSIGDDKGIYSILMASCQKNFSTYVDAMNKAYASGDIQELKHSAHTIKGAALSIKFEKIAELARLIEINSAEVQYILEPLINQFNKEWIVVREIIEKEL